MTKADAVEKIYEKLDIPRDEVLRIVDLVFDIIKETLQHEDKIVISGFGDFIIRNKRSRRGRNPQTGGEMEITARRVVTFRLSEVLKASLNSEGMTVSSLKE